MAFPDVQLSKRPLHFIYLCDCSGSMQANGKMQALNQAIRQSLPGMAEVARQNPEAKVLVRAVSFAHQARWHVAEPTPVDQLQSSWVDLQAEGLTAMGEALRLVAGVLRTPPMEQRALPPVLVLISDGAPTDDFEDGLRTLMREPWAQKAVRLAIAVGHDADLDTLQQFIGAEPSSAAVPPVAMPPVAGLAAGGDRLPGEPVPRSGRRPLQASNATSLAQYIQWASTAVVGAASMPVSQVGIPSTAESNVPLPDLPPTVIGQVVW